MNLNVGQAFQPAGLPDFPYLFTGSGCRAATTPPRAAAERLARTARFAESLCAAGRGATRRSATSSTTLTVLYRSKDGQMSRVFTNRSQLVGLRWSFVVQIRLCSPVDQRLATRKSPKPAGWKACCATSQPTPDPSQEGNRPIDAVWFGRFAPVVGESDGDQAENPGEPEARREGSEHLRVHIGLGLRPRLNFSFLPVKRQRRKPYSQPRCRRPESCWRCFM